MQAPEVLRRDVQPCPDQRGGVLHPLEPLARRRPEAPGGKRGLDHVRGAQRPPMRLRELVKRDQALPGRVSAFDGRRGQRPVPTAALVPEPRALGLRLGSGHGLEQGLCGRVVLLSSTLLDSR